MPKLKDPDKIAERQGASIGQQITEILDKEELATIPTTDIVDALGGRPSAYAQLTKRKKEGFEILEDRIYAGSIGVIDAVCAFGEIDPDEDDNSPPPESWVQRYGPQAARIRYRIAKSAWLDQNKAPVALKIAAMVTTGIARARALSKIMPQVKVNLGVVNMPVPEFPSLIIEKDNK